MSVLQDFEDPCIECGNTIELHWTESINKHLMEKQICFDCDFWLDIIREYSHTEQYNLYGHPGTYVTEEGRAVTVGAEVHGGGKWSGYSGRRFIFQHEKTCVVFETTNLWGRGIIPPRFKTRLPQNIIFLYEYIEDTPNPLFQCSRGCAAGTECGHPILD